MVNIPKSAPAFRFEVNWKLLISSLIFLPILVTLGFWQLNRAEQKRTILQTIEEQQALAPVDLNNWLSLEDSSLSEFTHRRVSAEGQFDAARYWLLENQVVNGTVGYDIVMPFKLDDDQWLLVNRGWIAGSGYRDRPPQLSTPDDAVELTGVLVKPSKNRLLRNQLSTSGPNTWPKMMLAIDLTVMAQQFDQPFLPLVMELDDSSHAALQIQRRQINMPPVKHVGYAVQWFSLAIALTILCLVANSNLASVIKNRKRKK